MILGLLYAMYTMYTGLRFLNQVDHVDRVISARPTILYNVGEHFVYDRLPSISITPVSFVMFVLKQLKLSPHKQ